MFGRKSNRIVAIFARVVIDFSSQAALTLFPTLLLSRSLLNEQYARNDIVI